MDLSRHGTDNKLFASFYWILQMNSSTPSQISVVVLPNTAAVTPWKSATCNCISVNSLLVVHCFSPLIRLSRFVTERNHNIRIPGFASDETRISLSQNAIAPAPASAATGAFAGAGGALGAAGAKKGGAQAGHHMTLRAHRLAQVQMVKKEAKLM